MPELQVLAILRIQAALPYTFDKTDPELQPGKPCFAAEPDLSRILESGGIRHVIWCCF